MLILNKPEPVILTFEEKEKYEKSKTYFYKHAQAYLFFYKQFSFFFKKRIKNFIKESDYYLEIRDKEKAVFKYKVAQAIANDDYEVNHQKTEASPLGAGSIDII